MNGELAEIHEFLKRFNIACACIALADGRSVDMDCSCRCYNAFKKEKAKK